MGFRAADLPNFIFALLVSGALAYIIGKIASKEGDQLDYRGTTLLAVATTMVVTIVRFSLPLSIALLAAMFIVGFRTKRNELSEVPKLFMVLAVGVGCGAGHTILTGIGAMLLIVLLLLLPKGK